MINKQPKIKTPRDLYIEEQSKKFDSWCRKNDMDFCSLERRAAWWAWLGRGEKDLEAYLNSVIDYQI